MPTLRPCAIPTQWFIRSPASACTTFAGDKATARISGEFYVNAINVMRGASSVSTYVGLPEQEAFNIEYWLWKRPFSACPVRARRPDRACHRRGRRHRARDRDAPPARRRLRGALPILTRPHSPRPNEELTAAHGKDFVRPVRIDVTAEQQVVDGFADTAVEFGGIDILVSNAGLTTAPVEETTLALWNRNMDILATGYFLVSREAFKLFRVQKIGGNVVRGLEERPCGVAQRVGLLYRQGCRTPSPLPRP